MYQLISQTCSYAKIISKVVYDMIVGTHFHQNDQPKTTMDISKRLVDLDLTQIISCRVNTNLARKKYLRMDKLCGWHDSMIDEDFYINTLRL